MLSEEEELLKAARRGDKNEVARLVDEEGVEVNSKDSVSVCVLCLLILVLFGIEWMHCSHSLFFEWPFGRRAGAAEPRSEPADQDRGK